MEPFAVYEQMAANAAEKINAGTFDFERDMVPHADPEFVEVVEGVPLSLDQARSSFPPILAAVAEGATFSWRVCLETQWLLAPDTALLVSSSKLTLAFPEGREETRHYRLTSVLTKALPENRWRFLHQHRSSYPAPTG